MPKIVVVDDDLSIREMLTSALRMEGHNVVSAIDGQEGLETIQRIRPDLIFLDLMMPRMDGYQVLEALQPDADLRNIPVIILTALGNQNQVVDGLKKGANDYITKPFNLQELLARANVQIRILELEQKIRQSEAYHRALFERAGDPEMVLDRNGIIQQANDAALRLLDVERDQLVNARIHDLVGEVHHPEFEVALSGAFDGSEIPIFEIQLGFDDGRVLPVDADLCPVDIEGQRRRLLHLRDIRRRKAAETRSSMIFEYIGDGILITDQAGVVLLGSRSAAELTGYSRDEIVGLDIAQFHSEEGAARWQDLVRRQESEPGIYEDRLKRKDGREIPVEWTMAAFSVGSEAYFIGVARNLTDRKSADEKRMEAERLNTLLEIAGGAAHEINQPLTAILGYAEMALDSLGKDDATYSYQQQIVEAALRINDILKRMQAVREYRTRPYADGHQIVDFEQSSSEEQ